MVLRVSLKTENEGPLCIFLAICCISFITKNIQVVNETHSFIKICDSDNTVIAFDVEKLL